MLTKESNDCIFCKDLSKRKITYWTNTENGVLVDNVIDDNNVVLYESEHFCVIPDISPLTIGHVLIVSKKHIKSLNHFDKSMAMELRKVVSIIDPIISNGFEKKVVHFEHGPGKNRNRTLRSVDHFHLHCVPLDVDLMELMKEYQDCLYKNLSDYSDLVGEDIFDYILCDCGGLISVYLLKGDRIKSQLLRELIFNYTLESCSEYSLKDYDWKKTFIMESYKKSKEYLNRVFGKVRQ